MSELRVNMITALQTASLLVNPLLRSQNRSTTTVKGIPFGETIPPIRATPMTTTADLGSGRESGHMARDKTAQRELVTKDQNQVTTSQPDYQLPKLDSLNAPIEQSATR